MLRKVWTEAIDRGKPVEAGRTSSPSSLACPFLFRSVFIFALIVVALVTLATIGPLSQTQAATLSIPSLGAVTGAQDQEEEIGSIRADVEKGVMFLNVEGSGDVDSFLSGNSKFDLMPVTLGDSTMQTLKANLKGNLKGKLSIDLDYDSTNINPRRKFILGYDSEGLSVKLGDMSTALTGLEFAVSQRSLFGIRARGVRNTDDLTLYAARLETQFASQSFQGDETFGPFFLTHYPVTELSERVYLDGALKFRGIDYELESSTGVMRFNHTVAQGVEIRVDYEYTSTLKSGNNFVGAARYRKNLAGGNALGTFLAMERVEKPSDQGPTETQDMVFGVDTRVRLFNRVNLSAEIAARRSANVDSSELDDGTGNLLDSSLNTLSSLSLDQEQEQSQDEEDAGRALRLDASTKVGQVALKGSYRQVEKGFRTAGNPSYDNNKTWYSADALYRHGTDITAQTRVLGERKNLDGSETETPERFEASTAVSWKVPLGRTPLLTYSVAYKENSTSTETQILQSLGQEDGSSTPGPVYKMSTSVTGTRETSHTVDLKYRIRKALFKTGVQYAQVRDALGESSSDDLKGIMEVKARIAKPVVSTLRYEYTDHNPVQEGWEDLLSTGTSSISETREGSSTNTAALRLDSDYFRKILLTADWILKRDSDVEGDGDLSASLRVSSRNTGAVNYRLSFEQKRSLAAPGSESDTRVLAGNLGWTPLKGLSLNGEIQRRENQGSDTLIEEIRSVSLDYDITKTFKVSAQVKQVSRDGQADDSDYDGIIRYFKATGKF